MRTLLYVLGWLMTCILIGALVAAMKLTSPGDLILAFILGIINGHVWISGYKNS